MSERTIRRRTALRTIAALGVVGVSTPMVGAASEDDSAKPRELPPIPTPAENPEVLTNRPNTYVAVVDRIVGGTHVVCLLEDDGDLVSELVVPVDEFPSVEEGEVLLLTLEDGDPTTVRRLEDETERRREANRKRLEDLSERLGD